MANIFTRFINQWNKEDKNVEPVKLEPKRKRAPVMAVQNGRSSTPPRSVNPAQSLKSNFTYVKPNLTLKL